MTAARPKRSFHGSLRPRRPLSRSMSCSPSATLRDRASFPGSCFRHVEPEVAEAQVQVAVAEKRDQPADVVGIDVRDDGEMDGGWLRELGGARAQAGHDPAIPPSISSRAHSTHRQSPRSAGNTSTVMALMAPPFETLRPRRAICSRGFDADQRAVAKVCDASCNDRRLAMFEKFRERLQALTNPYKGFLGELWPIWMRDAGQAVLCARYSWQQLPDELVQQAVMLERQAQAAQASQAMDAQVRAQLGSMGIFPGAGGGMGFGGIGFGMSPAQAFFVGVMGRIRAFRGDPPVSPDMVPFAEPVLRGQMDPVEALAAASPPLVRQQMVAMMPFIRMTGMEPLFRLSGVVMAGLALPHERIFDLLPPPDPVKAHQWVQTSYDRLSGVPADRTDERTTVEFVFRALIAGLVQKGSIANAGLTPDEVMDKLGLDALTARLTAAGWLHQTKAA
jgi:hypothetical protein